MKLPNRLMMVCLMATGLCFALAQASADDPHAGTNAVKVPEQTSPTPNKVKSDLHAGKYELVVPNQPTTTPDKVEVVELFWYTCPHCGYFEKKYFKQWRNEKPAHVEVVHMPAVFNKSEKRLPLAKAYYTAKALGVFEKIHQPLFHAIHDQKRQINDEKALQQFFAKHAGVSKADFTDTYNSYWVNTKINRAADMTRRYGITGVPVVIVNGRYRLSSTKTDGYKNLLTILDDLIEQEHQELLAKKVNSESKSENSEPESSESKTENYE